MALAIALLLTAAAAAYVLAPLWKPGPSPVPDSDHARLRRARDAAERVLRDIELDYATGKLAEDDYAELRAGVEDRLRAVEPPRE